MFSFHRANCSFPSMLQLALKVWLIITFLDVFFGVSSAHYGLKIFSQRKIVVCQCYAWHP